MKLSEFFKPSWKKLYWFFLVFLVAQFYSAIITPMFPQNIFANFIDFVLSPATALVAKSSGIEMQIAYPLAATINVMWEYVLGTLLAREVGKDKEAPPKK